MADVSISFSTDLAIPVLLAVFVVVAIWALLKVRRMPWEVSQGISTGLARFAKMSDRDPDYAAAYEQLSTAVYTAWDTKDPVALLPLMANPIVHKAFANLKPALGKFMGGQEAEKHEETYA